MAQAQRTLKPAHPGHRYTHRMGCWYVYLIECRDGSVYTGIATDVERRYAEHVAGKGARYTRSRPPLRLLARFEYPDRSTASRAEYAIKQLTPAAKRALCGP
jgi:putative endonuclease